MIWYFRKRPAEDFIGKSTDSIHKVEKRGILICPFEVV